MLVGQFIIEINHFFNCRARAQALIEARKAQGLDLPDVGERKPRLGTRVKPNKQKKEQQVEGTIICLIFYHLNYEYYLMFTSSKSRRV